MRRDLWASGAMWWLRGARSSGPRVVPARQCRHAVSVSGDAQGPDSVVPHRPPGAEAGPTDGEPGPAVQGYTGFRRAGAVVVGFGAVAMVLWLWAYLEQQRTPSDIPFLVWGILVGSLGLASGMVFVYGGSACSAIGALHPVDWRPLSIRTWLAVAITAAAFLGLFLTIEFTPGTIRGWGLTVLAIVGAAPAVTGMQGIRAASASSYRNQLPQRVHIHRQLRGISGHLLSALGSLVALTTFALGAAMLAQWSAVGLEPVLVLLTYGAGGTTLVAIAYQIPRSMLRAEARAIVTDLAPLTAIEASVLRQALEDRDNMERYMGLQTNLLAELQTGILILSPLLAAATTLLLRGAAPGG